MAIAPQEDSRQDGPQGRPVLRGGRIALASLAGCQPERVWALSDEEVRQAGQTLGRVVTAAHSALVGVLAEAQPRRRREWPKRPPETLPSSA